MGMTSSLLYFKEIKQQGKSNSLILITFGALQFPSSIIFLYPKDLL